MGDTEPLPDERAKALLGRLPSKADRDRLAKVRDALGIRSTDAVWDIMIALDYHLQLYADVPGVLAAWRAQGFFVRQRIDLEGWASLRLSR